MTKTTSNDSDLDQLYILLLRELLQAEKSCRTHCPREAERLGDSRPAIALRALASNAVDLAPELEALAEKTPEAHATLAEAVGGAFSNIRQAVVDRVIREERSYRGTLLGVRHGVDVARLLEGTARALGRENVATLCKRMLEQRVPLLEEASKATLWFVEHPDRALAQGAK